MVTTNIPIFITITYLVILYEAVNPFAFQKVSSPEIPLYEDLNQQEKPSSSLNWPVGNTPLNTYGINPNLFVDSFKALQNLYSPNDNDETMTLIHPDFNTYQPQIESRNSPSLGELNVPYARQYPYSSDFGNLENEPVPSMDKSENSDEKTDYNTIESLEPENDGWEQSDKPWDMEMFDQRLPENLDNNFMTEEGPNEKEDTSYRQLNDNTFQRNGLRLMLFDNNGQSNFQNGLNGIRSMLLEDKLHNKFLVPAYTIQSPSEAGSFGNRRNKKILIIINEDLLGNGGISSNDQPTENVYNTLNNPPEHYRTIATPSPLFDRSIDLASFLQMQQQAALNRKPDQYINAIPNESMIRYDPNIMKQFLASLTPNYDYTSVENPVEEFGLPDDSESSVGIHNYPQPSFFVEQYFPPNPSSTDKNIHKYGPGKDENNVNSKPASEKPDNSSEKAFYRLLNIYRRRMRQNAQPNVNEIDNSTYRQPQNLHKKFYQFIEPKIGLQSHNESNFIVSNPIRDSSNIDGSKHEDPENNLHLTNARKNINGDMPVLNLAHGLDKGDRPRPLQSARPMTFDSGFNQEIPFNRITAERYPKARMDIKKLTILYKGEPTNKQSNTDSRRQLIPSDSLYPSYYTSRINPSGIRFSRGPKRFTYRGPSFIKKYYIPNGISKFNNMQFGQSSFGIPRGSQKFYFKRPDGVQGFSYHPIGGGARSFFNVPEISKPGDQNIEISPDNTGGLQFSKSSPTYISGHKEFDPERRINSDKKEYVINPSPTYDFNPSSSFEFNPSMFLESDVRSPNNGIGVLIPESRSGQLQPMDTSDTSMLFAPYASSINYPTLNLHGGDEVSKSSSVPPKETVENYMILPLFRLIFKLCKNLQKFMT